MRIGIIGGGIYGTAIAYFLCALGDENVILFDQQEIGGESTSRSAGIIRHHYARQGHVKLAKRGREIIAEFEEYVGQSGGFHANGYLSLANSEKKEVFRETVETVQETGVDVTFVDPDQLSNYIDGIDNSNIAAAALDREAGFADPYLVATGFARAAKKMGADLHPRTEVTNIETEGNSPVAVETTNGREPVDFLINAAGPWGDVIGQMVGLNIPLTWHESKVVVLSGDTPYNVDVPTLSDNPQRMYLKPEPGDTFLIGGIERPHVEREQGLEGVTTAYLKKAQQAVSHRLPHYESADVVDSWSGVITATPDWYQIVGVPEGYENFYNAVGGSGHGFKEAAGFAESIAQEILGETPDCDLTPYRYERFEQGDRLDDRERAHRENR